MDVGDEENWLHVTETIKYKYGSLNILVNNAGLTDFIESTGPWDAENSDLNTWNEVHRVNLTGVMLGEGEERQNTIRDIENGIPLGHFGEPLDLAYGVLHLASDESNYVTGIELTIDGGILAGSDAKPRK